MRIFIAGITGVVGRHVVSAAAEAGHDVVGLARTSERVADIERLGARVVVGDALTGNVLIDAVVRSAPDAVVNELTALPRNYVPKVIAPYYRRTSELRLEGTKRLMVAARAAGCRRVVVQSIAFAGDPSGPDVVGEDHPLFVTAPEPLGEAVRAVAEMEAVVTAEDDLDGVALRSGFVYGPGSHYARDGTIVRSVLSGAAAIVGDGGGMTSFVSAADLARATVLAAESDVRGVLHITDDDPVRQVDFLPELARLLDAPRPRRINPQDAERELGPAAVAMATVQRGASNERARRALGWTPRHSTWREGMRALLSQRHTESRKGRHHAHQRD